MALPPRSERPTRTFDEDALTLREELPLTEKQIFDVRHLLNSDWKQEFVDVLPKTIVVHKATAEKRLGIKRCVFIVVVSPERLRAYAAYAKFCCRRKKGVNHSQMNVLYDAWTNTDKSELRVITTTDTALPTPADYSRQACFHCRKRHDEKLPEGRLFAIAACGHLACGKCWQATCKWALEEGDFPVPCPKGGYFCTEKLTITRAWVLFCDSTLALIAGGAWRQRLRKTEKVRCATCKRWLKRNNVYRKMMTAGCDCGCYTCVRCSEAEHVPLWCKDASAWSDIRKINNIDKAAAEAEKLWSLSREDFEHCLLPTEAVSSDQFKKNLRFMKTYDRVNGRRLEKDMPVVARMLEMRRVQQLAQRKEHYSVTEYDGMDIENMWEELERRFVKAVDTLGSTKEKAQYLSNVKEEILRYYHF